VLRTRTWGINQACWWQREGQNDSQIHYCIINLKAWGYKIIKVHMNLLFIIYYLLFRFFFFHGKMDASILQWSHDTVLSSSWISVPLHTFKSLCLCCPPRAIPNWPYLLCFAARAFRHKSITRVHRDLVNLLIFLIYLDRQAMLFALAFMCLISFFFIRNLNLSSTWYLHKNNYCVCVYIYISFKISIQ
jgi:hypothetical protein